MEKQTNDSYSTSHVEGIGISIEESENFTMSHAEGIGISIGESENFRHPDVVSNGDNTCSPGQKMYLPVTIESKSADGSMCAVKIDGMGSSYIKEDTLKSADDIVERVFEEYTNALSAFNSLEEEERQRIWGCCTIDGALYIPPSQFVAMFNGSVPRDGEIWVCKDASRKSIALILPNEDGKYQVVTFWEIRDGERISRYVATQPFFLAEYRNTGRKMESLLPFFDDVSAVKEDYNIH